MIIYNTTFHHDRSISAALLNWLKTEYIPQSLAFGFTDPQLTRVILPSTEEAVEAYALGLKCDSLDFTLSWESNVGSGLRSDMFQRWDERVLAFSTPMEIIAL